MRRRIRREVRKDRRYLELALENMHVRHGGMVPSLPFIYPTTRAPPTPHLVSFTVVRGPEDMLLSPLGQHILSYGLHSFPNTYVQSGKRKTSVHYKPSLRGRTSLSRTSPGDLDRLSNKSMHTAWTRSSRTFEGALGRLPISSSRYHWTRL